MSVHGPSGRIALCALALVCLSFPMPALAQLDLASSAGPSAVFRLDGGDTLYVAPLVDESGPTLQFAFASGLEGRARKQPDGSFADKDACTHRLAFGPANGAVRAADCHGTRQGRLQLAVTGQPLTFQASDGVTLGATIWTGSGKHRGIGVVLAHGADDETRQMGSVIPLLVEAGYTVLTYDQRGTGKSGGNWRADGVSRIADDMVQAAGILEQRTGEHSIGFYGFSNGGWVAPAVAVRFGKPAFVVIKSGDSQSVVENVRYETYAAVKAHFGAEAAVRAREVVTLVLKALETDAAADWDKARQALLAVKGQPWLSDTQLPPAEAIPLPAPVKAAYRRQLLFDPGADLQKLKCPVLVMLGDADVDVEGPQSARLYRKYFHEAHNARAKVVVFKNAGHQLVRGPGPAANNSLVTGTYVPGYPALMLTWLDALNRPGAR